MTTLEIMQNAAKMRGVLAGISAEKKNEALLKMAEELENSQEEILRANALDVEASREKLGDVMIDRLTLTSDRIKGMADGIRQVAVLPDPVGRVLRRIERPNGLVIEKVSVALGVVAIIYESRPNVTSDAAALAIKAGNACILRGGKEAFRSADAITKAMQRGLD